MKELRRIANGKFTVELHLFGTGEPLLFLHGAGGLLGVDQFLEDLGHSFKVIAPHLPGYGESTGAEHIDDILDAILFYHQLLDELGIVSAHVVGHSMGGMLAAEFAAIDVHRAKKLVLVTPAGFWLEEHPIPDVFAMEPPQLAEYLFHDPKSPIAQMITAIPEDMKVLEEMYVERTKRMTQASKFLWPIPDRGLKKRAYRIAAPSLVIMGQSDKLIPPVYANEFTSRIRNSRAITMAQCGHLPMYERPDEFVKTVREFLKS
jgi:pimeloyl-ACP methyl ester carboxylesterase